MTHEQQGQKVAHTHHKHQYDKLIAQKAAIREDLRHAAGSGGSIGLTVPQ